MKQKTMHINRNTYEEFFLLYNDGELNLEEKKAVEEFIRENPDLEQELILLQDMVLSPDENIVYENKEELYRHETRVAAIPWYRIAVAAVLLIAFGITGWLYLDEKKPVTDSSIAANDKLLKNENNIQPTPPTMEPATLPASSPSDAIDKKPSQQQLLVSQKQNNINTTRNIKGTNGISTAAVVSAVQEIPQADLPPLETTELNQIVDEEVAVTVKARDITTDLPAYAVNTDKEDATQTEPEVIRYAAAQENNTIYFANTALPKKSKLRVVFRKATRILDKVTSIQ